ncbi:MAG: hypothetical protein JSW00_09875 [Thermoplasmata archaeon]|nr:MAG: hypothetical protein JSW00_09875 [Thermoplasmata archaeon]
MDRKKVFAGVVTSLLLIAILAYLLMGEEEKKRHIPTVDLPSQYMVLVDEPQNEEDLMFIAALSSLVVRDNYNPMFIIGEEGLDDRQLWTIEHMTIKDVPKLLFTNSEGVSSAVSNQLDNVEVYERTNYVLMDFKGFDGTISVGSYEEALWVAPLANVENKMITMGKSTYKYQEDVWGELASKGVDANYVIVTNPEDYLTDIFYSEGTSYKDDGEPSEGTPFNATFHIPSLSAVAAEMAAFHQAYVLTHYEPSFEEIGYMDTEVNSRAIGLYLKLKEVYQEYGPTEYICLVGSAEAVPQFKLPDESSSDPASVEGDHIVECDAIYGFLGDDKYFMDSAVGRIINKNVQGASNQIARTFAYDLIVDEVEVSYSYSGTQIVNWRNHASAWNGFEVADQRGQMTPGKFAVEDFKDEGFVAEYMRTTGNEGIWGSVQNPSSATETLKETEMKPIVESSSIMAYRGHGSWHATFYVWEPEEAEDPQGKSRLEGHDDTHPDSVYDYYLPPQVFVSVCCENAKIQGTHWWGGVLDMEMLWVTNYFYSGGVGLIAATEVSYSKLAQDKDSLIGEYAMGFIFEEDNHQWDNNNCWYAFPLDGLINHEEEYGTIGKAHQWAENRYINNPNKASQTSPFDQGTSVDWKEVSMFVCYGDPAFMPSQNSPGANSYDPWHNGAEDQ